MDQSIPILYYHRVGAPDPTHLSIPTTVFDAQMAFLFKRGVKTISCAQVIRYVKGEEKLSRPSVAITFDDGFADNLTHALPILRKYGFTATVFGISSLVRPDDIPQIQPRSFSQAHTAARYEDFGDFLSHKEMLETFNSGTIEFHSHTHWHNQVFKDTTLTGIYPQTDDHWGILSAYGPLPGAGKYPIFPRGPGLLHQAFRPDIDAILKTMQSIPLQPTLEDLRKIPQIERQTWLDKESHTEYLERIREDFLVSHDFFAPLHHPGCDVLCWPWGATSDEVTSEAQKAGYSGAVLTSTGPNVPGTDPFKIKRFPIRKAGLAPFAIGYWLRAGAVFSRIYGKFHGWF